MSLNKVKAAAAGVLLAALMAGTALSGTIISAVSENSYKSWKQYGESWSGLTLGSSGETVAKSGCAVTSAAMLMVKSGSVTDESFTPGTIISYMSAHGGFNSDATINWSKLTTYAPSFVYCGKSSLSGTQAQKAAKMQSLMEQGYYLLAVVKSGGHFVAVDSVNGSNVTMMDPGSRSTSLFDQYAASGVISLRLFKGANSVTPEELPTEMTTAAETTEVTEIYTTDVIQDPTEPETAVTEETVYTTTEITTTEITTTETTTAETATETTTESTTTETTTTTTTTTTTAAPETTTTAVTTVPPMPQPLPQPVTEPVTEMPTEPVTEPETVAVIPSYAEAGLFNVNGQNYFMTVRFTTTDNLNLRGEPGTDADILLVIPEGTLLDVVETNEDFTWGRTAYNGKEGWIAIEFAAL